MSAQKALESILVTADTAGFHKMVNDESLEPKEIRFDGINLLTACLVANAPSTRKMAMFNELVDHYGLTGADMSRLLFEEIEYSTPGSQTKRETPLVFLIHHLPLEEYELIIDGIVPYHVGFPAAVSGRIKAELERKFGFSGIRTRAILEKID
jgi:hypothetical protein